MSRTVRAIIIALLTIGAAAAGVSAAHASTGDPSQWGTGLGPINGCTVGVVPPYVMTNSSRFSRLRRSPKSIRASSLIPLLPISLSLRKSPSSRSGARLSTVATSCRSSRRRWSAPNLVLPCR
jgi:hypothetical protein